MTDCINWRTSTNNSNSFNIYHESRPGTEIWTWHLGRTPHSSHRGSILTLSLRRALNSWSFLWVVSMWEKRAALPSTQGCCRASCTLRRWRGSRTINLLTWRQSHILNVLDFWYFCRWKLTFNIRYFKSFTPLLVSRPSLVPKSIKTFTFIWGWILGTRQCWSRVPADLMLSSTLKQFWIKSRYSRCSYSLKSAPTASSTVSGQDKSRASLR